MPGLRIRGLGHGGGRKVMLGDPISISVKSGTFNYMRWQMISLLDDVRKNLYILYILVLV